MGDRGGAIGSTVWYTSMSEAMDLPYLTLCGVTWCSTEDLDAGWELIEGLHSANPELKILAEWMLIRAGAPSLGLVEQALGLGLLRASEAGPCMTTLLRTVNLNNAPQGKSNLLLN